MYLAYSAFTVGQIKLPLQKWYWLKLQLYFVYSTTCGVRFLLCQIFLVAVFFIKGHMEDFAFATQEEHIQFSM